MMSTYWSVPYICMYAEGVMTNYYYDHAGNITSMKVKENAASTEQTINTATYDFTGNITSNTDGNGHMVTFEYNAFGSVRKKTTPADASISSDTMTFQYDVVRVEEAEAWEVILMTL